MQVTARQTAGGAPGLLLRVLAWTSARPGTAVGVSAEKAPGFDQQVNAAAGSYVAGCACQYGTAPWVADARTALLDNQPDYAGHRAYATFTAGPVPGAAQYGMAQPGPFPGSYAALEIAPGDGGPPVSAAAPGPVFAGGAPNPAAPPATVTTDDFTPAAGALLVALAASNKGTGPLTVSGGGLTWQLAAHYWPAPSFDGAVGIFTAMA